MTEWRFDQGRLSYFQFDEIRNIAVALSKINGIKKPAADEADLLRTTLKKYSELPFASGPNTLWRNYGRVFKAMLLATEINNHIVVTDLCKKIASDPDEMDCDDYMAHFAKNFYFSSPVFTGYQYTDVQVFPVIAVIKFLISKFLTSGEDSVSIEEIGNFLIANNVTGKEDLNYFSKLKKAKISPNYDLRQVRELILVFSQFSFLKWQSPNLYLEVKDKTELYEIEKNLQPTLNIRKKEAAEEILQMGSGFKGEVLGILTLHNVESIEQEFTEGKKIRVTHLRTERSTKLKSFYFSKMPKPEVCRMCDMDTSKKYPWSPHIIELHHLLPLASPLRVEQGTTSIKDLVGLCPSCHRATHRYYSVWFKSNTLKDFRSYTEAISVYHEAKSKVVLTT